jgi:hypothetical protein
MEVVTAAAADFRAAVVEGVEAEGTIALAVAASAGVMAEVPLAGIIVTGRCEATREVALVAYIVVRHEAMVHLRGASTPHTRRTGL